MRQVLMGLIIVSLAVMLGCVVHFGVYCKNATAGQPTPAVKKESFKVAVPAPKALPQVPDQTKEAIPDQVRVSRSCDQVRVSRSCDQVRVGRSCDRVGVEVQRSRQVSRSCDRVGVEVQSSRQVKVSQSCAPRLTLLPLRHKSCKDYNLKVETKVVRQKCYKGSGCGCGCGK
jgi:hypothetical protein